MQFWSGPNNEHGFQAEYPYVLDLRVDRDFKAMFPPLGDVSHRILITQAYDDLYNRIKIGLKLDSTEADGTKSDPLANGVLITGQPGTGTLPTFQ